MPHVCQMATQSREDSVYLAKLAEQAERYEGGSIAVRAAITSVLTRGNRDG